MSPSNATANLTACGNTDAKLDSKFRKFASRISQPSHSDDVWLGELAGDTTAARTAIAPLPGAVSVVVALCPEKEMIGIHADTVVALMEDAETRWDLAVMVLPAQPMGVVSPLVFVANTSVPVRGDGSLPYPATSGSVAFGEFLGEPCSERFVVQNSHVNLLNRLARPRVFTAPRGHLDSLNYTKKWRSYGDFPHGQFSC